MILTHSTIEKVRRGVSPSEEELSALVDGYLSGAVSKEETTDFLRAVCASGLSDQATCDLTNVMLRSGDTLTFKPRKYPYADKHSTGGLADSTTLIVAPVVASCGVPFLKMSGRKLGHTGGTIDKLELFKGLRTELTVEEAERVVDETGVAVIAQTEDLVPADKALYKLRDETNTVKSLPLIASSVVSKKLASGAEVLVLDVKTGKGAFMESVEDAVKLATLMTDILFAAGRQAAAVISDMNSPLGDYVGGVLEVGDALDVLAGKKGRLRTLALILSSRLLSMAKGISLADAKREAEEALASGRAEKKLREMVSAQGGETALFDGNIRAKYKKNILHSVTAKTDGYLAEMDCVSLGYIARDAEKQGAYGIFAPYKIGDFVEKGASIFTLYGEAPVTADLMDRLEKAVRLSDAPVPAFPLVYEIVERRRSF